VSANAKKFRNQCYCKLKQNKLSFLFIFAVIYGLVFINYIDIITDGYSQKGYHLWLVLMYFLPFAILSVINLKNWKLTIGLGLVVSIMNDVFYGLIRNLIGAPYDLSQYYNRWLLSGDTVLFSLNLGFATIPVQSWMMALSIYLRIAVVFFLLGGLTFTLALIKKKHFVSQ